MVYSSQNCALIKRFPNNTKMKGKLSLYLTKHHTVKMYWGMEVQLHTFLISPLDQQDEDKHKKRFGCRNIKMGFSLSLSIKIDKSPELDKTTNWSWLNLCSMELRLTSSATIPCYNLGLPKSGRETSSNLAEYKTLIGKILLDWIWKRGTVLYCTVLYCNVLYCIVLYCINKRNLFIVYLGGLGVPKVYILTEAGKVPSVGLSHWKVGRLRTETRYVQNCNKLSIIFCLTCGLTGRRF
jgi:hypothetical protein